MCVRARTHTHAHAHACNMSGGRLNISDGSELQSSYTCSHLLPRALKREHRHACMHHIDSIGMHTKIAAACMHASIQHEDQPQALCPSI